MMKILTRTAAALCITLAAQLAHGSGSATTSDGRYQGVQASETAVWVVDTRTGQVRKCTQEFADSIPVCSGFSG